MRRQQFFRKIIQIKNNIFSISMDKGVVFLLFLFCPYIASMYISHDEQFYQENAEEKKHAAYVLAEKEIGMVQIPLEEYLKGVLPSIMPMEYETTSFKVQAILLRSLYQKGELVELPYLSETERKEVFGVSAQEYENKLEEAVNGTKGLYLSYGGKPIDAAFCRLSAGNTRSGEEVLGEEFIYLKSVPCKEDLLSDNFQTTVEIEREKLFSLLQMEEPKEADKLPEIVTDSTGYVLWITDKKKELNGEMCAQILDLPSTNFTWEVRGENVRIMCKGVGHGFGCSQYSVNEMAKDNKNFEEIIHHFFTDVTIEKIE